MIVIELARQKFIGKVCKLVFKNILVTVQGFKPTLLSDVFLKIRLFCKHIRYSIYWPRPVVWKYVFHSVLSLFSSVKWYNACVYLAEKNYDNFQYICCITNLTKWGGLLTLLYLAYLATSIHIQLPITSVLWRPVLFAGTYMINCPARHH